MTAIFTNVRGTSEVVLETHIPGKQKATQEELEYIVDKLIYVTTTQK